MVKHVISLDSGWLEEMEQDPVNNFYQGRSMSAISFPDAPSTAAIAAI
jgi:hypothetical protein